MTTSSAMSTPEHRHNPPVGRDVAIGVVGATGAVGPVTLDLLRDRGYENVRAFASARSAGKQLGGLTVEEATPEALSAGDLDLCLFSIGTAASRELVPHAVRGGAVAIDKSSAYRLQDGIPLVVPEVNGERALEFDGEEFDEESKLRAETRKILELPELPVSATCVRVPVMVGHAESVWIETVEPISPEQVRQLLAAAPSVRLEDVSTPRAAAGEDEVLVGRIRADRAAESNGIALFLACDNLRKGAALNAIQIAELILARRPVTV